MAGRRVDPSTAMHNVMSKEAQRVRRNVDKLFERCRRASSVAEFFECIDSAPNPVRDVARTIVLGILNSMGFNYATWEEARRDARNIPYYYLAMQFGRS